MRPSFPLTALALACLVPLPAAAVGVDLPKVREDAGMPCVDLTRIKEGDALRVVSPPPCGPDARVRVRWCEGRPTVEVWMGDRQLFRYQVNVDLSVMEDVVDLGSDDDCP